MQFRAVLPGMFIFASVTATVEAGPIPPGRQHLLTIEGENTVTFVPQVGLPEFKIDYQAKVAYIIDTRFGKEAKPSSEGAPAEKIDARDTGPPPKTKGKRGESPASKATGAVDLSLHSSEMTFRQNGQAILETK